MPSEKNYHTDPLVLGNEGQADLVHFAGILTVKFIYLLKQ